MSTRQKGNRRENLVGARLEALGYCVCYARGSRGRDILAVHREPSHTPRCLWISVGGADKRIAAEFRYLKEAASPIDTVFLVALCRNRQWDFYASDGTRHETIASAIQHTMEIAA